MSDMNYRPGEWQVVVEESGIAALPADASADKVVALSDMLSRGVPSLTEVIDVLSGGAITGLGSFAVALIGPNGTRFAVRGAVTVNTGWEEGFSGEDITTWSERFIADVPRFEIGFVDPADAAEYPIRSGVVLASGIRVGDQFTAPVVEEVAVPEEPDAIAVAEEEPEPEPESEPDSEAEPIAEPEPEPVVVPEPVVEEPEPVADAAPTDAQESYVSNETITPDEVVLVRGTRDGDDSWNAPPAEPDVAATIAPPALSAPPVPPAAPASDIGDHDGATISLGEARRLRQRMSAPDAPTEAIPAFEGEPSGVTRTRIHLSTGQVVELDRPVIIGRKPRSTRASGSTLPHLIAVDSPDSDISRNHLEVRPEGDSVVVIDLHTTNGSTLLRPGADPVRLHPGEQTLVLGGDVIDVGDGVTITLEEYR